MMLEALNLAHKYTHIFNFKKYVFQYQDFLNFADVSIFTKKPVLFGTNSTFTQSNSMQAVLEIFQFFFRFVLDRRLLLMKICFTDYTSRMQLSDCPELAINQKTGNEFLTNSFLLSSLVTGPSFMSRSSLVLEL